jgi:hypothetical protein
LDVDGSGSIEPFDVLYVVNELNEPKWVGPNGRLPRSRPADSAKFYYDANGDGFCTPFDALRLVNFLNTGVRPETEYVQAGPYLAHDDSRSLISDRAAEGEDCRSSEREPGDESTTRLDRYFAAAADAELTTMRHTRRIRATVADDSESDLETILNGIAPEIGVEWDGIS